MSRTSMSQIAERYLRFARTEAAGRSPAYERLAQWVAASPRAQAFLASLPQDRQQPNLLFAALRMAAGTPGSMQELEAQLDEHGTAIAAIMRSRTTQTNEPGRCAALLPVLARIEGPLALIEVGASAGLCLMPDAYAYDWGRAHLTPAAGTDMPLFPCKVSADTPLPSHYPEIVWRAGLDLNPLDVNSTEDMTWLETLVWPEHETRLARLRQAVAIARRAPPRVVRGDLRQDLDALIAEAPPDATVVVFHTAVLSYVPQQEERDAFARAMIEAPRIRWICNEGARCFAQFSKAAGTIRDDMFLLSVDGTPTAWSGPHGQSLDWIAGR